MNEGVPKIKKLENEKKINQGLENSREISGEMIEKALTSPEFVKTLKKTIDMVLEHRREIGFAIAKDGKEDSFYYSDPIGGMTDNETRISEAFSEIEDKLEKKNIERSDWFPFGSFHFHRYQSNDRERKVLIPSWLDIESTLVYREKITDFPQVEMIGNLLSKADVRVLIYQESANAYSMLRKPFVQEELENSLRGLAEDDASRGVSQEEVIQELKKYGFNAGMVNFKNGRLAKENRDFIHSLGNK